jgi:lipopolysaccharide transport system ATP-binding protein
MGTTVLSAQGLGKIYRLGKREKAPQTALEACWKAVCAPLHTARALYRLNHFDPQANDPDTLWALKDVSFDVEQGDVVGVIGRNGAGKSTLLKIFSKIVAPTCGAGFVRGKLSSLLEIGTGFHPELTGRENIFLNGSILGMRKAEIVQKMPEIIDFSGLEPFLDTPVKRYSSGMYVRLAFAVAAHLNPDILIVDEVLAVGDIAFQKKCLGKMNSIAKGEGRTLLLVSHNMGTIAELCNKVLYLHQGSVRAYGPTNTVIEAYLQDIASLQVASFENPQHDQSVAFTQVAVLNHHGQVTNDLDLRMPFTLQIDYKVPRPLSNLELSFRIHQVQGHPVFTSMMSECSPERLHASYCGPYREQITLPGQFLVPGTYSVSVFAHEPFGPILDQQPHCLQFTIHDTGNGITRYKDYANMGCVLQRLPWEHSPQSTPSS